LDGALVAIFIAGVVFLVMRVVSWYLQRD
jgi:hypothetical protein